VNFWQENVSGEMRSLNEDRNGDQNDDQNGGQNGDQDGN